MSSGREITASEVKDRLTLAVQAAGAAKAFARENRFSPQYVGEVIRGREDAGPRLLAALGVRREVRLVSMEA